MRPTAAWPPARARRRRGAKKRLSFSYPPTAESWRPQGARLGWLDADYLYLTPDATYAAVVQMAREQGETFTLTQRTLWKRLDERGVLMREPGQEHYTSRVRIHGKRERVARVLRQKLRGGGV